MQPVSVDLAHLERLALARLEARRLLRLALPLEATDVLLNNNLQSLDGLEHVRNIGADA